MVDTSLLSSSTILFTFLTCHSGPFASFIPLFTIEVFYPLLFVTHFCFLLCDSFSGHLTVSSAFVSYAWYSMKNRSLSCTGWKVMNDRDLLGSHNGQLVVWMFDSFILGDQLKIIVVQILWLCVCYLWQRLESGTWKNEWWMARNISLERLQ